MPNLIQLTRGKTENLPADQKRLVLPRAGHRCGCMLAKQMGGYSDGCALSGEGRVVSCYQK